MTADAISVVKVRNVLLVTMPMDPTDTSISKLQDKILMAMKQHEAQGVVLDISAVETLDSFFARTVVETANMVALMGGRTAIVGMQPNVAITTAQLGLRLGGSITALDVDRAMEILGEA